MIDHCTSQDPSLRLNPHAFTTVWHSRSAITANVPWLASYATVSKGHSMNEYAWDRS
ncbi:uncharacterized protein LAESUDRAFT_728271 [Laetiporus sulphureus 93-53]|uniref:Uncharacterized protein n=1 Tax=Laetiporus sulphureus 93-53 TaxID=1314785 RepID=A0A165D9V3_9APHY|nr:uncharacterized protein LAESUDRAFT_728271 [Laetiporus sulphureus 93-53]KZT04403.1 hypothetical protein LAESUDRAFT_728271 [Laetiporus sulphureus 93-53]